MMSSLLLARSKLHRPIATRLLPRFYSQADTPSRRTVFTHVLAGVAGGGVVIAAGYTWYHFSGIKKAVDAAQQFKSYMTKTKESVAERHPNEALKYIRAAVKSYCAIIPGSGLAVDKLFDSVDTVVAEHQDEAASILQRAKSEIEEIVSRRDDLTNVELSSRIMAVVGTHLAEIGALGAKASGNLFDPVTQRLPESAWWQAKSSQTIEAGNRLVVPVTKKLSELKDASLKALGNKRAVDEEEQKEDAADGR